MSAHVAGSYSGSLYFFQMSPIRLKFSMYMDVYVSVHHVLTCRGHMRALDHVKLGYRWL